MLNPVGVFYIDQSVIYGVTLINISVTKHFMVNWDMIRISYYWKYA